MNEKEKKRFAFPKGFFTKDRPHADKHNDKDMIPFKWSENVLNGKSKVKIVSLNKKNMGLSKD